MSHRPDDELDDADHAVIARLRALRPEGVEPAWDQFGRDLARELDAAPPRPWWQRWWAPVAGLTLAGATAAAVILWPAPTAPTPDEVAVITADAAPGPPTPAPIARTVAPILALGSEGELDDAALDDDDVVTEVLAALDDEDDDEDPGDVPEDPAEGLVPDLELEWIDDLDDEDLDAVTAWLDEET